MEDIAEFRYAEFPDKDHNAAGNHARQRAPFIGTPPEQCAEDHRSEGRAEAGPCEGYDLEYGTARIPRQKDADHGDGDHGASCDGHGCFFFQLDAEEILHDILRNA